MCEKVRGWQGRTPASWRTKSGLKEFFLSWKKGAPYIGALQCYHCNGSLMKTNKLK